MRNILSATYNLESSEADYVETESPCELYETMSDGLAELLGDEARPLDSASEVEENDSFSSHFQNEEGYEWVPKEELKKNTNHISDIRDRQIGGAQYLSQQKFNQGIYPGNIAELVYSQIRV